MREARLPLQAPDFNADAFTRADGRELCLFQVRLADRQTATHQAGVSELIRIANVDLWG